MISFILNNEKITTGKAPGTSLLDFIRYEMGLSGTKAGCREGDCGACTVLMGSLENNRVNYKSAASCLTTLGNVHGKHIVTIEGIRFGFPTLIQKAFADNSATQCGFCTPGFVMSVTAECLTRALTTKESLIASMSGNICRCTGYKSIERTAETIAGILKNKDTEYPLQWLTKNRHLPEYFLSIPDRLREILKSGSPIPGNDVILAGGTDLMVRMSEEVAGAGIYHILSRDDLRGIQTGNERCVIGAATTFSEMGHSADLNRLIPGFHSYMKLVASEPVRNMATVGGNIVNASPIGDMTIILLALDAEVIIEGDGDIKPLPLKELYLGYKKLNISKNSIIKSVVFGYHNDLSLFNFEKVSKRTHLDIASVNSAIRITMDGEEISKCSLSAGGVSPVPLFLAKTAGFLKGRGINAETVMQANEIMQAEISPISDVRGSAEYKRLLLRQLLFAHFLKLFPGRFTLPVDQL